MSFKPQMSPRHAEVFKSAARHFNVYILVRRTNLRSLAYVGDPNCAPKRLDCKAKTADRDWFHPQHGAMRTAGLVVDPTITGHGAFATERKHVSALKEWGGFAATMLRPQMASFEAQRKLTYVPGGGFYFVDLDPKGGRFGCVRFTSSSLISAGKLIHGDFDLYGIVRADDPSMNVAVWEKRLDVKHVRSPEFFDVQHHVNRGIGVPMVLHGAQEGYGTEHSDEGIDIFHPDGTATGAEDAGEIARLYATVFKGRQLFRRDGPRAIVRGHYATPA